MRIGVYVSAAATTTIDALLERFARAEESRFHTAWVGQLFDHDALTLLALAARATRTIELGTWVVPTPPRHPSVLAQQALTVQAASGNRLVLGVGASHEEIVAKRLGLPYARPARELRDYLAVLRPLLAGEPVLPEEPLRVSLRIGTLGAARPPVLVGALGPEMLRVAGQHADGAAIWLGGPRYLASFAIPRLREAARRAGRPAPRIACGLPIAVSQDTARARSSAEAFLAGSARLPAYRRVLEREGAASPAAVALVGEEASLAQRIDELARLGVTDLNAVPFPVEGDPEAVARTLRFLSALRPAVAAGP